MDYAKKARVFMQRKLPVLFVSEDLDFGLKLVLFLSPMGMQVQQVLIQPDNNYFFSCPVTHRSALCTNGGENSSSPHPAALLGGIMSKARRAWFMWKLDSSSK